MARSKKTSDKTGKNDNGKASEKAAPEGSPEEQIEDAVVISETPPEEDKAAGDGAGEADTGEPEAEDLPEIAAYVEGGDEPDAPDEDAQTEEAPTEDAAEPEAAAVVPESAEDPDSEAKSDDSEPAEPAVEETAGADDDTSVTEDAAADDPADDAVEDTTGVEGETFVMTESADGSGEEEAGEPSKEKETEPEEDIHVPATRADAAEQPRRVSPVPAFAAMVLGGVVAAGIGYAVAISMTPEPPEDTGMDPETAAALSEQADRLAQIEAGLGETVSPETVEQAIAPISETVAGVDSRIDGVESTLSALDERLADLSDRVETIAMRPESTGIDPGEFDQAITEFRQQLESAIRNAQVEIDEARQEAERISEEAFNSEQSAIARAAWREVRAALEGGAPYAAALAEVAPMLDGPVPEVLAAHADDGLPTLADLQAGFPEAARAAIAQETREEVDGGTLDRVTSFLKVQTGYRSLEPRAGDDADAVLSRAEAALRGGDLTTALAEVDTLDGPAAAAMNGWTEAARARVSALDAAADISARLLE